MSPNLDRLITVAEDAYQDACLPNEVLSQRTINAMVCAVLKELRKPSEDLEVACRGIVIAAGGDNWDIDYKADQMRAAMIDYILTDAPSPETQSKAKAG